MFGGSLGQRWNSLTQGQKIFVGALGALVIYGLVVAFTRGGGLGRYTDPMWWLATAAIIAAPAAPASSRSDTRTGA